jgi:myo-inositol 2-dehydrogenase/D-chiro-inositol 1-dehydrogenase
MEKLKVAQIGVGMFGKYRRDKMRDLGLFDLIAAYDINEEALKVCAEEENCAIVSSYDELLDYPEIEAMIISTGAKFHAEQVIKAARKGLHVFVEKPLCCSREEVAELREVAKETGVVISVGHNDHTEVEYSLKIKEMIENGTIGTPSAFEKTTAHSGGLMIKKGDWRGDPDKNPGGMLFQCGVHSFHELRFYFGEVEEIFATTRNDVNPNTQTDDIAICNIRFKSGVIGNLNAYHVTTYRHTLNIFGDKSNIYFENRYFDEGVTLLTQEDKHDNEKQPCIVVPLEKTEGKSGDLGGNLKSFYNAIRTGSAPYPSLEDGAQAVELVFAAIESSKLGKAVKI